MATSGEPLVEISGGDSVRYSIHSRLVSTTQNKPSSSNNEGTFLLSDKPDQKHGCFEVKVSTTELFKI